MTTHPLPFWPKMFVLSALFILNGCGLTAWNVPTDPGGDKDTSLFGTEPERETGEKRYHPENYASAKVHGLDTRIQKEDCRSCHGTNLTGGESQVDCDSCHQSDWRENCTYCHGGDLDNTGAPPGDLNGEKDPHRISFMAHSSHVGPNNHPKYDCDVCHKKPTDVLSKGHMFDNTPGRAEVAFHDPLSTGSSYDGNGGCSNVYCHGNGQGMAGSVKDNSVKLGCASCHPDVTSDSNDWYGMSGEHALHLFDGMTCTDCHQSVVSGSQTIIDPSQHVDGAITNQFSEEYIAMDAGTCTGLCHFKIHLFQSW